ncbi:MAG: hypothetical protein OXH52_09945 [Gammaproteobacteria bacterium]|nr:hypothetical protein [Gammaproteobacteria bacterium]
MRPLPFVFWLLVAGNAVAFSLIWLEQALAAMESVPGTPGYRVPAPGEESPECVMLGPLGTGEEAGALVQRIQRGGGRAIVRSREILRLPDYVVHVEPSASRDLAMQTLRELKDQAIDGHLIPDGRLANAVSVGVFGLPAPAEVRRAAVANLGYNVDVARVERRRMAYSVYSDEPPADMPKDVAVAPCREF